MNSHHIHVLLIDKAMNFEANNNDNNTEIVVFPNIN